MKNAINYLCELFGLDSQEELYKFFVEEIQTSPSSYYQNPLCAIDCVHIVNIEYPNQAAIISGTLDLVDDCQLFSTCYLKKASEQGVDWSEPLFVELSELMICQQNLPQCLYVQPKTEQQWIVDELDNLRQCEKDLHDDSDD
ncbi:hypothetical protein niasHT_008679 [Heterodera trifolii]|uniref:Uncharacterized protein n=1 Tax=Heterodera trifolii TaxID=157864 RepID=A0ABD2M851_9BILA